MPEVVATAGAVRIVITGEGANFSAAVAETNKQLDKLGSGAKSAGTAVKKEMTEARGTIMVLGEEIGVHLPRHVQKFVAGLPGVASAMSAAFDAVAIFAIGAAIVEITKKVYEFVQKNGEAARANAEAWRSVQAPLKLTNDELQLSNDRLENAIAKLEHKPTNGLKEAIDEAIVSADQLGQHLDADLAKVSETLSKQETGVIAQIFGASKSSDLTKHSKDLQDQLAGIALDGGQRLDAMRKQGATEKQIEEAARDLNQKRLDAIKAESEWAAAQLKAAQDRQNNPPVMPSRGLTGGVAAAAAIFGHVDEANRISQLMQYLLGLSRISTYTAGMQTQTDLTRRKDTDQAGVDNGKLEMQRSEELLADIKARNDMSLQAEVDFWQERAGRAAQGSDVYNAALRKANDARAAIIKRDSEETARALIEGPAADKRISDQIDEAVDATWRGEAARIEKAQKEMQASAIEAFKLTEQSLKAAQQIEEERIKLQVQMGEISKSSGAQQLQTLHEEGFKQWAAAAGSFRSQFPDVPTPGAPETLRQYGVQSQGDAADVEASSALGRLEESALKLSQSFTDIPAHITEIFERTLGDLNSKIVDELSGKKNVNFGEVGVSALKGVETMGLQYGEGKLLQGLGIGKLGTKGNPMHVIMDSIATAAGSVVNGAGGAVGGMLHAFHIPGFATGGPIPSNMPAIVGENGPELFMPSSSGRIIPNDRLSGGDTHFHIDARGATDPAAVKAQINQALSQFARQVPSMSVNAVRDHNSRVPSGSRVGR
jgi:hypothetical protein